MKEGEYYPFMVLGKVTDVEGEAYYKLADPNGIKHLLKAEWYGSYGLEAGRAVVCHINKINCSGRIFIEPEHPVYRAGEVYGFEVAEVSSGGAEKTVTVKDVFGNAIVLAEEYLPPKVKTGDSVRCRVITVKKGKPVIIPFGATPDYSGLTPGVRYPLKVVKERKYTDDQVYYILEDEKGKRYPLRKKFYARYGFTTGDTISCVLRNNDKGGYYLEPEHPRYRPGERFEFRITGKDHIFVYPEGMKEAVILENRYGKDIIMAVDEIDSENIAGDKIVCRVKEIVEGRLFLDCM